MLGAILLSILVGFAATTFDPELHVKFLQLPRDQFVQHFNKQNYTWKIKHHAHLENRKLGGDKLLDKFPGIEEIHFDPKIFADLPENFDAREHWPNCKTIREIYDQGNCKSGWAFGVATVASDRTCIHKGINARLSEQDLTCLHNNTICDGGVAYNGFFFWIDYGLVTQECKPYDIKNQIHVRCKTECKNPSVNYLDDKHKGEKIYSVPDEDDVIKAELLKNGPIEALLIVYEDFGNYTTGIYEHKYGEKHGYQNVRIIGYGVENGVNYWLAANSWGKKWGENGFFRIKRHQPEVEFEKFLIGGVPKK